MSKKLNLYRYDCFNGGFFILLLPSIIFCYLAACVLVIGNVFGNSNHSSKAVEVSSTNTGTLELGKALHIPSTLAADLRSNIFKVQVAQAASKERTAYVHLFEWKWTDVARECENFLGPKGYAAVQVSPPQEHRLVKGFPWYQRYQPVSYKLDSRSGNQAEFTDMVKRCKVAGVDIYVDTVINHMTGVLQPGQTEIGSAGSRFGRYKYPDYIQKDFHHCNRHSDDDIQNWFDRYEVQNCELLNLADLDTGSEKVRSRITAYLNNLVSLGVAGFRIDAAKHMPAKDLANIFSQVQGKPYIYQEIIAAVGEPIQPPEYFSNGSVTEFKFSRAIGRVFRKGKLVEVKDFQTAWSMMPSNKAVVFTDNHDNQRGHGDAAPVLTYKHGQMYVLANVLMLALPYGYPQVMSSYKFEDSSQGPPSDAAGRTKSIYDKAGNNIGCFKEWMCEHRIRAIANMVNFRNYTASDLSTSNWWSNDNNQIAFGRGNKGFVIINGDHRQIKRQFQTPLAAGSYCNVIDGELTANRKGCTGSAFTVDTKGRANILVPPQNAVVIGVGGGMEP